MAFLIAGIIMVATVAICIMMAFGDMMRTVPSMQRGTLLRIFLTGMAIAALVAASHWLPWIGW